MKKWMNTAASEEISLPGVSAGNVPQVTPRKLVCSQILNNSDFFFLLLIKQQGGGCRRLPAHCQPGLQAPAGNLEVAKVLRKSLILRFL